MNGGTIYALSSGAGRAGLAVIRVSGADAGAALRRLTGRPPPPARRAVRARIVRPDEDNPDKDKPGAGEILDDGLVLWFPAPASVTGEDVAELHVHGGPAVIAGVLAALARCPGLRLAEPGEFTRRAFENGKLDLTAAEGVADLIAAETEAQRRQALRQLRGGLAALYEAWRARLLAALAHLEAVIDFSDEDLPGGIAGRVRDEVAALAADMNRHLADHGRGERLRDGVHMAIIGPPNAGKSSLLNLLSRRDAAIVSALAGTTRDVIEVHLDLAGYPLVVADTAGMREGAEGIEAEGVRRARARAEGADLRLLVLDRETWPEVDRETAALIQGETLVVVNKVDLGAPAPPLRLEGQPVLPISLQDGTGIDTLMAALGTRVARLCADSAAPAALTRARHREALEGCVAALDRARGADQPELAAEDLRLAARALGRITGRVDVEDLLDVIFRDFCIGK